MFVGMCVLCDYGVKVCVILVCQWVAEIERDRKKRNSSIEKEADRERKYTCLRFTRHPPPSPTHKKTIDNLYINVYVCGFGRVLHERALTPHPYIHKCIHSFICHMVAPMINLCNMTYSYMSPPHRYIHKCIHSLICHMVAPMINLCNMTYSYMFPLQDRCSIWCR